MYVSQFGELLAIYVFNRSDDAQANIAITYDIVTSCPPPAEKFTKIYKEKLYPVEKGSGFLYKFSIVLV